MNKLIVICGPTATGKTALAVKMAKKFNGEIISADSRQVYRGMDIGTGKELGIEREAIKKKEGYWLVGKTYINLYDVVTPDQKFSPFKFYQLAWQKVIKIWKKGKLPILVGGTGFYIKAVVNGLEGLGVKPDERVRKILGKLTVKNLQDRLLKIDPERFSKMNKSDINNPRRLIRAIEIAQYGQNNFSLVKDNYKEQREKINPLFIGLAAPQEVLVGRTNQWTEKQIQLGLVKEVKKLLDCGWGNTEPLSGIIYNSTQNYINKKMDLKQLKEKIKQEMKDYVRRQMVWFKKEKRIHWFDITNPRWESRVEQLVAEWYNKN